MRRYAKTFACQRCAFGQVLKPMETSGAQESQASKAK